ncbi:peptidase [Candidatus Bipolaricaulota bacterium]|nr:peptidase [Candidatus Bipolaricaulota bacterium]
MFDETRKSLEKLGLPKGDLYELTTSEKTFPDGAHFRIEVPTINSFEAFEALIDRATELGITINRIDETYGIFRHTLSELRDYCTLAKERGVAVNLSVGPRAPYDTGATVQTPQGVRIAYRLRGMEQVVRAVEDVKRAVSVGCRGILVYDEGLLWVLVEMRKAGELPADLQYKVSAHCGHANPAAFKVLESMGAHTINPVRDLQLPMLAALRCAVDVPLDLHTDNPPASGGFIRSYEAPEMVRVASPVYLKTGNSAVSGHGIRTTAAEGRAMAEQASIVVEMVHKYLPEAKQSGPGPDDAAIPV